MGSCIIIPAMEPIHPCLALLPRVLSWFSTFSVVLLDLVFCSVYRSDDLPSTKATFPCANHHRHPDTFTGLLALMGKPSPWPMLFSSALPSAGILILASELKDYSLKSKRKQELVMQDTRIAHVLGKRAVTELDDKGPSSA